MARFAKNFLIGASTAAHQVEGNNTNSDFWALEHLEHSDYAEPSLDACNQYHRYEEDILLMKQAGLNAYRFSIEWARIEPQEGVFDAKEIEHYRSVIRCCRENGIEPVVTLHHFSSPKWLISDGGWEDPKVVERFAKYAKYVAEQLKGDLHIVCTINEANMRVELMSVARTILQSMIASGKVQAGINLEQMMAGNPVVAAEKRAAFGTDQLNTFLTPCSEKGDALVIEAHKAAKAAIKAVDASIQVGLTLSLHDLQSVPGGEKAAQEEWEMEFGHYLPEIRDDDFLGVQNYTRTVFGPDGEVPVPENAEKTQMGYEFYPQALESVIRRVAKDFHGDILVTENGIATGDDTRRTAFIDEATKGIARCIEDGLPVKAYLHWSLLDNFEWQRGYSMTFGLIAVDRQNGQVRKPKDSLAFLGSLKEQA